MCKKEDVLTTIENPINARGAMTILNGNLAPEGDIVKYFAIDPNMQQAKLTV